MLYHRRLRRHSSGGSGNLPDSMTDIRVPPHPPADQGYTIHPSELLKSHVVIVLLFKVSRDIVSLIDSIQNVQSVQCSYSGFPTCRETPSASALRATKITAASVIPSLDGGCQCLSMAFDKLRNSCYSTMRLTL